VSDESVWQALEARGATIASVPFSGRAGRGGRVDRIVLYRLKGRKTPTSPVNPSGASVTRSRK
jgi:hypothetical protein